MKNRFKKTLLSSVILLASFGSIATSYAQVAPPPAPATTNFVAALVPAVNLLLTINHNVAFLLIRATEMENKFTTLLVHTNQMIANTNAMNANLNAINANILNVSNKSNASAVSMTEVSTSINELRDYFVKGGGASNPGGVGGISNIPWYDSVDEQFPRLATGKKLAELFKDIQDGATFIESGGLTSAISTIVDRFSLQDSLVETTNPTPQQKKDELANSGVLISGVLAAGLAERTFNRAEDSMSRVQGYLDALQVSDSVKTSLDINTRVLIELLQTTNENIKMLAASHSLQTQVLITTSAK